MSWGIPNTVHKAVGGRKYITKGEVITIPDSAGANVVTAYSSVIEEDVSNKKFVVQAEVIETCAGDGAIDIAVQASLDGVNFVDVDASLSLDLDPTGTNVVVGIADTTGYEAPYYRFKLFTDGTDTQDAAQVRLTYAVRLGN